MDKRIEDFLNNIFRNTQGSIELRAILADEGIVDRLFTRSMKEIEIFVSRHINTANIYFGICTRKPGSTTGRKEDVQEIVGYWADMDFKDYGQEQGGPIDLEKGESVARKILDEFPSPPSIIVQTGGGLHVYWLFQSTELIDIENLESVLKGICNKLRGDRSAAEIARVLRLPFTTNFPSEKKIESGGRTGPLFTSVESMTGIRYNFKEFSDFYKTKGDFEKKTPERQKIKITLFKDVEEKLNRHLENNFVLQTTWQGNRTDHKDQSRSGHDMGLADLLAKLGFTPDETKAVLKKFPYGKGEKDGNEGYFDRTVSKAFTLLKKSVKPSEKLLDDGQDFDSSAILDKIYSVLSKKPHLIEMSEVEEAESFFLVEPYILGDAVTLLGGDGGEGKSQIGLAFSAQISKKGNICIFSNEDKPGTIKKRLKNQDADLTKISLCSKEFDLSSADGQAVMIKFLSQKNPLLVIIDSLVSYSGNKDLNKSGDVRQIINFLNAVARHFKCAALVILHLNKGEGKAIYKISGSTQIVAAARSVLIAGCKRKENNNTDEDSLGAIFHIKANESQKGKPLGYSLGKKGLKWVETDLTITDILDSENRPKKDSVSLNEAKEFLQEILGPGAKQICEIKNEAKNLGISQITLRRAKDSLKIKSHKMKVGGQGKNFGFWELRDDLI